MRWIWLCLGAILGAACSSGAPSGATAAPSSESQTDATTTTTTTTAPVNRPPELRVVESGRAQIGQRLTEPILGFDPDGDDVNVTVANGPLGFSPTLNASGRVTGFGWEPIEPGEWTVLITATDPDGATATAEVLLVGRNPRSIDMLLAMGDSVAAGFGRDRSDFLGSDECFRSEDSAYGVRTHQALREVGALDDGADVLLVACSEATVRSLLDTPVQATQANGDVRNEDARSQVDWAVDLNPTIITLTTGVSNSGLFNAEEIAAIATSSAEDFDSRLGTLEQDLDTVLERLVTATDAHIAVTTYYDPTATVPVGVDGCTGVCFADAFSDRMASLNVMLEQAVNQQPSGRVSLVRLDGINDIWEASDATGPDQLRDGLGPFQGIVDRFTSGGLATCASSGSPQRDLISGLDCLHPNVEGHDEITRLVVDVLLSI